MAGTVKVDTVQSSAVATPPAFKDSAGTEMGQLCRAWVNFNGVTTATIRASFNVSSVVRNGVGDYTVNFTNAMADANYAIAGAARTTSFGGPITAAFSVTTAPTSGGVRTTVADGQGAKDVDYISISVFR